MSQDTITIPVDLLDDLIAVCRWHKSLCTSMRYGETYELHGDQQAFDYLESEACSIQLRAETVKAESTMLTYEKEPMTR